MGYIIQHCKVQHNAYYQKKETHAQRLYIKGQTLSTVDRATYLWVELLSDITLKKQVKNVAAKANRNICFIGRTVPTSFSEAKAVAYKTVV